ncbi:hypothetical protein CCACVL1_17237 [Corchorus capsularis]|uniref:TIR domain-containing protein n=1 Tax=Corchorus capsularis TaxID=210143 RepID=A0A1R3HT05_COCAP|nr:hypothetical protein CCACVL1_17237 [Corchorus capsularis]
MKQTQYSKDPQFLKPIPLINKFQLDRDLLQSCRYMLLLHHFLFIKGLGLSFCGKDTRKNFTDHLYTALTRKGIKTFRDDKSLERGEDFAPELLTAIRESWGSIIVLSEGYVYSNWCLDELVHIVKQREEWGHRVYPIFFHVQPSDTRHQRNTVEAAFKQHEMRYNKDKAQIWRLALKQLTGISGWPLKDQHESIFIEDIVKEISEKLDTEMLDEQEIENMRSTYRRIQAILVDAEKRLYVKEGKLSKFGSTSLNTLLTTLRMCWTNGTLLYSNPKLKVVIKLRLLQIFHHLSRPSTTDDLRLERPKTTSLIDESDVYGRDDDKHTVIDRLLQSDNNSKGGTSKGISLIAIVGMGGLGKTTLAQLAFNDDDVKEHFPLRIWVCVSDPFDELRIAKVILETLKVTPSESKELEILLQQIRKHIEGKKFLLVLDDVWTENEQKWEQLKLTLSSGSQASRILVTTRKKRVASVMGCIGPLISLGVLSNHDSWSLFSKIAFKEKSIEESENLKSIGRKVVEKCGGLPLAIKSLASLLWFKRTKEQWQRILDRWQKILDSEMWKLEDEIFERVYAPLLLSYYDLPMTEKQCFRYCAIFPKNHEMEREELIKLWMAQGFLGEAFEGNDLEVIGEECFDNLAIRGFFQEFEKDEIDDNIIKCKMHDIAKFLTKTESLLVTGDGAEVLRGVESSHGTGNIRHLTLFPDADHVPEIVDMIIKVKGVEKLRSFLVDGTLNASLVELIDHLISLRMLCFYTKPILIRAHKFLAIPKEIGQLIHLRYLGFEGNENLRELPEAICDLCNLQTLNIRRCKNLQKLPPGMGKLINLRHLQNVDTCIRSMPKGMERLTSLLTLEEFVVNESKMWCRLEDLGKLIHLRGHLVIIGLGNYVSEASPREALLSKIAGLRKLTLDFDGGYDKETQKGIEDEASLLQALEPPQNLQILWIRSLRGPVFSFPNRMTTLASLRSVVLFSCHGWESLPPMGKLPSLESLKIQGMSKVKILEQEFLGSSFVTQNIACFPNLKYLEFRDLEQWEEWEYVLRRRRGEGDSTSPNDIPIIIMPKLQHLAIWDCPKLRTLPRHILQSTRELDVPGEIYQRKTYPFEFSTVEMPYESLNGVNERLSYFGSQMRLVYVKARECEEQLSPEEFAILLGKHFTSFYLQVINLKELDTRASSPCPPRFSFKQFQVLIMVVLEAGMPVEMVVADMLNMPLDAAGGNPFFRQLPLFSLL